MRGDVMLVRPPVVVVLQKGELRLLACLLALFPPSRTFVHILCGECTALHTVRTASQAAAIAFEFIPRDIVSVVVVLLGRVMLVVVDELS